MSARPSNFAVHGNRRSLSRLTARAVLSCWRVLVFVGLLGLWHFGHVQLGPSTVASPADTMMRVLSLASSGELLLHLAATLRVTAIGLGIGWFSGLVVALLLARYERLALAVEPYILGSMGVPKYALAPLLILWFGIGDAPKVVVTTLMVFYVVFITTIAGCRSIDPRLIATARLMGAGDYWVNREIVLSSVTPYFLAGLKVAIPRAISAAVVGEFLVADHGLGHYIEYSRQTADTVGVYAGLVVVAVLVLGSDMTLELLRRRVLSWMPKDKVVAAH